VWMGDEVFKEWIFVMGMLKEAKQTQNSASN
jgi:hypothetical protein